MTKSTGAWISTGTHAQSREDAWLSFHMYLYRLHDTTGDDLGLIEHPAPNVEPGDVAMLADGREALITARVDLNPGRLAAMLEIASSSRSSRAHPAL